MLGQSGGGVANHALSRSDLIIIIGARVGDRAINKPSDLSGATIVHIDIDSAEIGKNVGTTIPLVGDAARVIEQLAERGVGRGDWPEWIAELDAKRREEEEQFEARAGWRRDGVDAAVFVRKLSGMLPDDAVYVADVGQNQIWSANNYMAKGRFLTTGGMGTMGYSLPAAIGAKLARPDAKTVAVMGDGAFQMSMNELATVRRLGLPLLVIVMNNGSLGLVRELQKKAGGEAFAVDISEYPDYGLIAAAYGVAYKKAYTTDGAVAAADDMLARDETCLLECAVDPEEASQ
jgi:acetolactate synthase-1/2/3 large subunit